MKKSYVFAGASSRALDMYCKPMLRDFPEETEILGVYDINAGRARTFVAECGGSFGVWEDFDTMLRETRPDRVIVTTVDETHADYICRSLRAGCDVITEKPMATTAEGCRAILAAERESGHRVIVTFNYRYVAYMSRIKELLASGAIGEVLSVHFEWLLTRNLTLNGHGASYFRRWNARMARSGGLLVHKSTHHFDLVNWWTGQKPETVAAFGALRMYGGKNSPYPDVPAPGLRCAACRHAEDCPFFYAPTEFERRFYVANEAYDGYMKDNCVFATDIDIYDTMSVNVRYDGGAMMSYSLNATSPYEGWHIVFNGTRGRLEADNYERGVDALDPKQHILVYDLENNVADFALTRSEDGHGGGDIRLRRMLFAGDAADPLGCAAGAADGAYSVLTGVAANRSIIEGREVSVAELLKG